MRGFGEDSEHRTIKIDGIAPYEIFQYCAFCDVLIVGQPHVLLPLESVKEHNGVFKGDLVYFPSCVECFEDYLEGENDEKFDIFE